MRSKGTKKIIEKDVDGIKSKGYPFRVSQPQHTMKTITHNPIVRSLVYVTPDGKDRHNIREFRDGSISYITFDLLDGNRQLEHTDEDAIDCARKQLDRDPNTKTLTSKF